MNMKTLKTLFEGFQQARHTKAILASPGGLKPFKTLNAVVLFSQAIHNLSCKQMHVSHHLWLRSQWVYVNLHFLITSMNNLHLT